MPPSRIAAALAVGLAVAGPAPAQQPAAPRPATPGPAAAPATPTPVRSAPLENVRYEITFDSASARERTVRVAMSFDVAGPGPVLLSLPAWTPGAYEISNFARWVSRFSAAAADQPQAGARQPGSPRQLDWDKLDPDTWRLAPAGARQVTVRFDYRADTLDNAMAWTRPDFALFNGTNLLPYAEGLGFDRGALVRVRTQPGWLVATGMQRAPGGGAYREANYHDLVDMPFFVGRLDLDSTQVGGRWVRLATYPEGALAGAAREEFWRQVGAMIPPMAAVFGETPWRDYTMLLIFDQSQGGGSALEHQNSHVGIYNPAFVGSPLLASITAHEIFHAWNVKRLRPAEMVPYRYDAPQPTPWLWVSEGITDYYGDLALVRGGVVDSTAFLDLTSEKVGNVAEAPPTALEDASLSTWIHPADGSGYLYYPKGSLAGFLLDVLIRDASDNRRSLDDVMRSLYQTTYRQGRGFTGADWWRAVSEAAGPGMHAGTHPAPAGRSFAEFAARYVDGREPFPYDRVLPLAGLRLVSDTVREPRLGIATALDSSGIVVAGLQPGGAGAEAGLKPGDRLLALGGVTIMSPEFAKAYRARFGRNEGDSLPIQVVRGADTLTLSARVRLDARVEQRLAFAPAASPKAVRIRRGIMTGTTDGP